MNRWRVGEDRGSKETDRCLLTDITSRGTPTRAEKTLQDPLFLRMGN
jgi:hypothetical protein